MSSIMVRNKCNFEFIASQIESDKIICVFDGYMLLLLEKEEIPEKLFHDFDFKNELGLMHYNWRSKITHSAYVFFSKEVNEYLLERYEKESIATPIRIK